METTPQKLNTQAIEILKTHLQKATALTCTQAVDCLFKKKELNVGGLIVQHGKEEVRRIVATMIRDASKMLNVGKNMNGEQIVACTDNLIAYYPSYRLDDYKACLNTGCMGTYGKVFDRFDMEVLFDWFKQYDLERDSLIILHRMNVSNQHKNASKTLNPVLKDVLNSVLKEVEKPKKEPKKIEPSEEYNQMQIWLKEWDALRETNNVDPQKRFISYNGRILDVDAFLSLRIKENLI